MNEQQAPERLSKQVCPDGFIDCRAHPASSLRNVEYVRADLAPVAQPLIAENICLHCNEPITRCTNGKGWLHNKTALSTCRKGASTHHDGIYQAEPATPEAVAREIVAEWADAHQVTEVGPGTKARLVNEIASALTSAQHCEGLLNEHDALCATVLALRDENSTLKKHWADTSEDLASAWLRNDELKDQLAQVTQEPLTAAIDFLEQRRRQLGAESIPEYARTINFLQAIIDEPKKEYPPLQAAKEHP